jgi:UDP-glucose 4-epimerase
LRALYSRILDTPPLKSSMKKTILLTGGAGFIGSHTYIALVNAGFTPLLLDNFSNSNPQVLERLASITQTQPKLIQGDIRDTNLLKQLFSENHISAVIHFAGLKAVGESVSHPLDYYDNNIHGTLNLLKVMSEAKVKTIIFSSSASVYSELATMPLTENSPQGTTNPYAYSKLCIENILHDLHHADPSWNIARLRYFNALGAHESGLIGEDPQGVPNNLMPYIAQVAVGRREYLNIFGGDYPTPDGTAIRDYIHVMDLAEGHVTALQYLQTKQGLATFNLGRGEGVSVFEMIDAFEHASGKTIAYKIVERRAGDIATCWSNPTLAKQEMGWIAARSIHQICADVWRWQSQNPKEFLEKN